ncbi:MAG: hypothetical protein V7785_18905 [Bermanella sp.]
MIGIFRNVILVSLFVFSSLSQASSPLTEHALAISQSMSAFYMYSLSEGDKRYERDYLHYFEVAEQHLQKLQEQDALLASELKNKWDKLRQHLKFEYIEDVGFVVSGQMRGQFRQYLNNLYVSISKNINSETNFEEQLLLITLNVEIMSARFFDISSSVSGAMNMSSNDRLIDPPKMAKELNEKLLKLQNISATKAIGKNLRLVSRKWKFIEDSVINYKEQSAYLLVYYNKKQIHKLISKSQNVMAGI